MTRKTPDERSVNNSVYSALVELGVVEPSAVQPYCESVRDRPDISVKRCGRSGVIFLDTSAHVREIYYAEKKDDAAFVDAASETIPVSELEDTARRATQFAPVIRGKRWLDFGTGRGQILDALKDVAVSTAGIELNNIHRSNIAARGHQVSRRVEDFAPNSFDIVTMFHVLEHLENPIGILRTVGSRMAPNGRFVIEVPHARDALLELYGSDAFKRFTLWSEHLVLHTRESLRAVIEAAGLKCEAITGFQRYPVSNHLHWLRLGRPGGHNAWSFLDDHHLTIAYAASLARLDMTDTLIAYASSV